MGYYLHLFPVAMHDKINMSCSMRQIFVMLESTNEPYAFLTTTRGKSAAMSALIKEGFSYS